MIDQGQISENLFYQNDEYGEPFGKRRRTGGISQRINRPEPAFTASILQVDVDTANLLPARKLYSVEPIPLGLFPGYEIEEPFRFKPVDLNSLRYQDRTTIMIGQDPAASMPELYGNADIQYFYDDRGTPVLPAIRIEPEEDQRYRLFVLTNLPALQVYREDAPKLVDRANRGGFPELYDCLKDYYHTCMVHERREYVNEAPNTWVDRVIDTGARYLNMPDFYVALVNSVYAEIWAEIQNVGADNISRTTANFLYRLMPRYERNIPRGIDVGVLKAILEFINEPLWRRRDAGMNPQQAPVNPGQPPASPPQPPANPPQPPANPPQPPANPPQPPADTPKPPAYKTDPTPAPVQGSGQNMSPIAPLPVSAAAPSLTDRAWGLLGYSSKPVPANQPAATIGTTPAPPVVPAEEVKTIEVEQEIFSNGQSSKNATIQKQAGTMPTNAGKVTDMGQSLLEGDDKVAESDAYAAGEKAKEDVDLASPTDPIRTKFMALESRKGVKKAEKVKDFIADCDTLLMEIAKYRAAHPDKADELAPIERKINELQDAATAKLKSKSELPVANQPFVEESKEPSVSVVIPVVKDVPKDSPAPASSAPVAEREQEKLKPLTFTPDSGPVSEQQSPDTALETPDKVKDDGSERNPAYRDTEFNNFIAKHPASETAKFLKLGDGTLVRRLASLNKSKERLEKYGMLLPGGKVDKSGPTYTKAIGKINQRIALVTARLEQHGVKVTAQTTPPEADSTPPSQTPIVESPPKTNRSGKQRVKK